MGLRVMMVYTNLRDMNMIHPGVALLSTVLKQAGHKVALFDTTSYESIDGKTSDSDSSKAERLMARPFKMPDAIQLKTSNCFEDFEKEVRAFQPHLLALSSTEDMWNLGIK